MGKYRYARSNGQFLDSRLNNFAKENTIQNFRSDQSYDLSKDFVTGTNPSENSFILDKKNLNGYESKASLLAWWRPGNKDDDTSAVKDSSGNNAILTPPAVSKTPTLDVGDTPSKFISNNSFLFDGSDDCIASSASSRLVLSDGTKDEPFSVSMWLKASSFGSGLGVPIGSCDADNTSNRQWLIQVNSSGNLKVVLYDNSAGAYVWKTTNSGVLNIDTWEHVVLTYDGRSGTSATNGVKVYVNLEESTYYAPSAIGTYSAMDGISQAKITVGAHIPSSTWCFAGSIADVAIWNKVLSSNEIENIHNVKSAGAYRLVRDFSRVSPDNDTRILGIATERKGFNTTGFKPDIMNQFVQGINVKSFDQLLNYTATRIRPNSSFVKTLRGKDISRTTFDETVATTAITSGSHTSHVFLGGEGRLSDRLTNEREWRDLGQTAIYDTPGAFEDTLDLDPTAIVSRQPEDLILPYQMVAQTSAELLDGTIEPLTIRSIIDRSSIEGPFYSHTFRADLGGQTDAFRRSYVITDGVSMHDIRTPEGASPFLDSVENLGKTDMPGAFSDYKSVIDPYVDYANDRDKEYTINSVSSTISAVLVHSSSWKDSDDRTHEKMAAHGFQYDNNPIGIDSIAYGGLKK
tara:strand:- start:4867 stop:6759 length:1893 start_codon:yes stop_codon:yes gene_type:complete